MSRDTWGRLAQTYDEDHTRIAGADLVAEVQRQLADAVPRDGAVVELGCGTGLYTAAYARGCERVTATDISPPMVEIARRRLATMANVDVRVADAVATGLPEGSADAVVAVNLLHVVPDAAAVVAEARRLLRPGGVLVAVDATGHGVPVGRMLVSIVRVIRRWGPLPPRQKGQRDLDRTALEGLVRAAGFVSADGHTITGHDMNAAVVRAIAPAP